jgi:hypothetical protein
MQTFAKNSLLDLIKPGADRHKNQITIAKTPASIFKILAFSVNTLIMIDQRINLTSFFCNRQSKAFSLTHALILTQF